MNDKVGQFHLPIKSANKKAVVCHAKIVRFYCPTRQSPNLNAVTRRNTLTS